MTNDTVSRAELQRENVRLQSEVERLQKALTIAQQLERQQAFLENTTDLVTIVDQDGRFTFVNQACEAAFGLPSRQLIGTLAFEFIHPDDRDVTREAFARWVRQRAKSASFENRQVSRDGTVRVFLWTVLPQYGEGGDLESVWSIARDITELRGAEQRLRESQQRYRILAESAPDMVFVVERDGVVSYLNRAAAAVHNAKPEELLGKPLSALFPAQVAHVQHQRVLEVLKTGRALGDVRAFPLGDTERHLDTALVPILDEQGTPRAVMGVSRDVTERMELQEDLRAALEDLRLETELTNTIIDSTPGVFYVLDFEGRFVRWNDSLEVVTGLNREEMAATNALALFEGEDQQRIAAGIQETARVGQATVEARILHKEGRRTPYLFTGCKIEVRGEDHLVGMGIDITSRLQQERALRERIKELRCLYEISTAVSSDIAESELLTMIASLIPSGWQYPGSTRARIEFDELIFGEDTEDAPRPTSLLMSAEIVTCGQRRGQLLVWRTDDDASEAEDPFLDEERDLLTVIARIISEAIERRQNATQFKRLLEQTPLPMCLVNEREELAFPNARFSQTFGYTPEEIPTLKEWWQLAYPDEEYRKWVLHTWNEAMQKAAATKTDIEPIEYRVTCKDGSVRVMEISGVVIGKSLLATFVDLTARREAEDVLRNHRDQLEAEVRQRTMALSERTRALKLSNRELNAFAYSVSHDLRAPLRSITGFTHALLEDYHEQLDADGKDYLERCSAAARRMGQLIDDLLTLSRITRSEMRPDEVDFSGLARSLVDELRSEDPTWDGEVVVQPGIEVFADRRLLHHAIRNLLHNARKFSAKTTKPKVEVGSTELDGETALFVKDNGAGFDMAYADNLFTPFHRLHKETEFVGTGIGLSIVQRIVRMHGGRVWAESAPEQGATFYFTLAGGAAREHTEEDA